MGGRELVLMFTRLDHIASHIDTLDLFSFLALGTVKFQGKFIIAVIEGDIIKIIPAFSPHPLVVQEHSVAV